VQILALSLAELLTVIQITNSSWREFVRTDAIIWRCS